ncbi:MAG: metal ABC transporter substrate-binding protein [Christensenellales bacterium]|jgi:ABC-type Zn uptake system ZnuABC Zn-binding protein ZnuA
MKYRMTALFVAVGVLLAGCAPIGQEAQDEAQIYASFYPIYALSGLVLGDVPGIRLACLAQPQDGCLRDYALSDWDMRVLAYDADAVIIGGRGLEAYEEMLYALGASGPPLIRAQYGISLYNQADETQITEESSHLVGANPHRYLSVPGAREIAAGIAEGMAELYPEKADAIAEGAARADAKLADLQNELQEICAGVAGEQVILMNETLIYPALDYGLEVAYWYDRESAHTLYGADLDNLIAELNETGARVVLIEKQAPKQLIDALDAAGYAVARIDILSTYALGAGYEGYLEAQRANARAIAAAYDWEGD